MRKPSMSDKETIIEIPFMGDSREIGLVHHMLRKGPQFVRIVFGLKQTKYASGT
jgi:hypothetical protein